MGLGVTAAALIGCEQRPGVPAPRETRPTGSVTSTPSSAPTPSIRRGGTWRMALAADPGSLDPGGNYKAYPCWARAALSGNARR